jgi:hypothetical protein
MHTKIVKKNVTSYVYSYKNLFSFDSFKIHFVTVAKLIFIPTSVISFFNMQFDHLKSISILVVQECDNVDVIK